MKKIIWSDFDGCPSKFNKAATMEQLVTPIYYLESVPDMSYITMLKILLNAGYDVRMLTKVLSKDIAEAKRQFMLRYGVDIPLVAVPYDEDKASYIEQEDAMNILIDDFTPGLRDWEKYGDNFIGIKYFNGINGTKGTWNGYSINSRMTAKKMAYTVMALADLAQDVEVA